MSEGLSRRVESLFEVSGLLASSANLEALLEGIIDQVQKVMNAQAATIYLRVPGSDLLEVIGSRGRVADKIHRMRLRFGQGIAGEVARTGKAANVPDAYADPRFVRLWDDLTGFRTRQMLAMPMVFQGATLGVVAVLNRSDDHPFDGDDEKILNLFSTQTAMVIHLAQERARHEQRLTTTSLFSRGVTEILGREVTVTEGYLTFLSRVVLREGEGGAPPQAKVQRAMESLEHSVEQIRRLAITLRSVVQAFSPTPPERISWQETLEAFHREGRFPQCPVFLLGNEPAALFTSKANLVFVLDSLLQMVTEATSTSERPFLAVRARTDTCDFCICTHRHTEVASETLVTQEIPFVAIESAVALLNGEIFSRKALAEHGAQEISLEGAHRFTVEGSTRSDSTPESTAQVAWQLSLPLATRTPSPD